MDWTPEQVKTLKELWNKRGYSASDIAKELGTTKNAVIGKVGRLRNAGEQLVVRVNTVSTTLHSDKTRDVTFRQQQLGTSNALFQRKESQCKWPIGDPLMGDFSYCQHNRTGNRSYCGQHSFLAKERSKKAIAA